MGTYQCRCKQLGRLIGVGEMLWSVESVRECEGVFAILIASG